MLERAFRLPGDVDLSLSETLDQIVRRKINQLDGVRAVEHRVRHGLTHADVGDLSDDVIQTFNVLNSHRGIDVDTVAQHLFDIEIPLRLAAAGRTGVGELVDQNDLRVAGDDGIEVHLLQQLASILDTLAGDGFQTLPQRFGFFSGLGFDYPHQHRIALLSPRPRA